MVNTSRYRTRATFWGALAIGGAVLGIGLAIAQAPGVQVIRLATGRDWNADFKIKVKEPIDVGIDMVSIQPGAATRWHYHPGSAFVVIKSGVLTEEDKNGCVTVHPTGSSFFEEAGQVHRVLNQGSEVADLFGILILPADAPPVVPVPDPTGTTCKQ